MSDEERSLSLVLHDIIFVGLEERFRGDSRRGECRWSQLDLRMMLQEKGVEVEEEKRGKKDILYKNTDSQHPLLLPMLVMPSVDSNGREKTAVDKTGCSKVLQSSLHARITYGATDGE